MTENMMNDEMNLEELEQVNGGSKLLYQHMLEDISRGAIDGVRGEFDILHALHLPYVLSYVKGRKASSRR